MLHTHNSSLGLVVWLFWLYVIYQLSSVPHGNLHFVTVCIDVTVASYYFFLYWWQGILGHAACIYLSLYIDCKVFIVFICISKVGFPPVDSL